jgi:hypothetical protein
MSKRHRSDPLYKKSWFLTLTALVGLVASGLGIQKSCDPGPPKAVYENAEIVIDRSRNMATPFDGSETKLAAAEEAVALVLKNQGLERDNLALREIGGSCDGGATGPQLAFSVTNEGPIMKRIHALKPEGEATLVRSVLQAIVDFNDVTRFKDVSKRIIVITGSSDACGMSEETVREKLDSLKRAGSQIQVDFHFVGVGLDDSGKAQLLGLAKQTGGEADFADTRQELRDKLREIVQDEPVVRGANAVLEILNSSVDRLNPVVDDLKRNDYEAGRRDLDLARAEFRRSDLPFQDLGKRGASDEYSRIYRAASLNRDLQSQIISLTENMLPQSKAHDETALQDSFNKYASLSSDYNTRTQELASQINQLAQQLRQVGSTARGIV